MAYVLNTGKPRVLCLELGREKQTVRFSDVCVRYRGDNLLRGNVQDRMPISTNIRIPRVKGAYTEHTAYTEHKR